MTKRSILIQLDGDEHPSVFDRVVAVDSGVDELFSYGGVTPEHVRDLVHGAIFTRGGDDLRRTAFFVGGSDVAAGEALVEEIQKHMIPQFGLRVSILMDANGCNTTAAAAVHVVKKHLDLTNIPALVLGGTGPVGQRVARLLAREGAHVRVGSRKSERAAAACDDIRKRVPDANLEPCGTGTDEQLIAALERRELVVAAGAAGIQLLSADQRRQCSDLKMVVDLNAVPPLGIEGVDVTDKAKERDGVVCYGAVGVGGTKMKIHRAAVAKLFDANDQVMDAEEVFAIEF